MPITIIDHSEIIHYVAYIKDSNDFDERRGEFTELIRNSNPTTIIAFTFEIKKDDHVETLNWKVLVGENNTTDMITSVLNKIYHSYKLSLSLV